MYYETKLKSLERVFLMQLVVQLSNLFTRFGTPNTAAIIKKNEYCFMVNNTNLIFEWNDYILTTYLFKVVTFQF